MYKTKDYTQCLKLRKSKNVFENIVASSCLFCRSSRLFIDYKWNLKIKCYMKRRHKSCFSTRMIHKYFCDRFFDYGEFFKKYVYYNNRIIGYINLPSFFNFNILNQGIEI